MALIGRNTQFSSFYSLMSKPYAEWIAEDPVIPRNVLAIDETYQTIRIGNGTLKFSELRYSLTQPAFSTPEIIGIEWDTGSSDPTLRRIDLDGNTVTPDGTYWQTHPIFSQMVRVRLNDQKEEIEVGNGKGDGITLASNYIMTRIPRIYVKFGKYESSGPGATQNDASGRYYRTWISPYPHDGFILDPAFYQEGYTTPAEFLYIGSFSANNDGSVIGSKSGVASTVSQTMATFYSKARAIGSGWGILDVYDWALLQRMFYIWNGNLDCQNTFAPGRTESGSALASGSAQSLINVYGNGGGNKTQAMAWYGIENLWGNIYQYLIGFNVIGGGNIRIVKPDGTGPLAERLAAGSFLETSGITPVIASGTYPSAYHFVDPLKFMFLPSNNSGGSSSSYLCDGYYGSNAEGTTYILLAGGGWSYAALAGIGCANAYFAVGDVAAIIGARLRALK